MTTHRCSRFRLSLACGLLLTLRAPRLLADEPTAANLAAFHRYAQTTEARLADQHRSDAAFIAGLNPASARRLQNGELLVEHLTPPASDDLAGAILHHWRGTAFAPGATATAFERLIRDFNTYPKHFAPEVTAASVLSENGPHMLANMRVRQHHVITVVMDATYDINFGRLDSRHGYSLSQSTRIAEIDAAGTSSERELSPKNSHGFLWRLNTYWSYEVRDGGLYLQIESISLTRSIPTGLGWVVKPYIESIPRESLEFTLRSAVVALTR